jgi:hypothetical protein
VNLQQLIDLARSRLDDNAKLVDGSPGPNIWTDAELIGFFNEAQYEACERADLIRDEFTDAITLINVVENQQVYVLDESVYKVDRVMYADTGMELDATSEYELDNGLKPAGCYGYGANGYGGYTYWRGVHSERSRFYIVETLPTENIQLRLVPIPMEYQHVDPNDNTQMVPTQFRLTVYRFPLQPMVQVTDSPEINVRHHIRLIDWVAKRAFEKRDRDTYDPAKSADAENAFTASFGIRPTANQQRKLRERRKETTRYHSF